MATSTRARSKAQTGPRAAQAKKEEDNAAKITVDGVSYKLGDLTLGELEELEEHVGLPMDMLSWGSAKVISFVVWLVRRRADPGYSLDDAKNIKIDAVNSDTDAVAEVGEGPTEAASE